RRRHTRWPRDWSSDVCSSDLALDLDRARDQELAVVRAPRPGGLALGAKGQAGLVDLDQAGERLALGVDHRVAELPQEQPGALVEIGRASCRERVGVAVGGASV